ncbi:MAG: hypothetical protein GY913_23910 [Proteobacteria bacterium]|nr:hypothetical protein [Pseudomonadota bacterium]MCP4919960.1 hypothetical protein [Pseudomonadota bacterium]
MMILMALTGCKDPTGIWLFELSTGDFACEDTISENYDDGSVPGGSTGTSDWTIEYDETVSPMLMFGQIAQHSSKEGVLVIGDEVYPGTLDGGIWTFAWTGEQSSTESETHTDGYGYTYDNVGTSTTTWTLDIAGDDATGQVAADINETHTWTEDDEWDPAENGQVRSNIPSTNYLVDDDGFPVESSAEESDCSSANCELSVQTICSGSTPISATWSGFLEEDAYEGVSTAGQDYGI